MPRHCLRIGETIANVVADEEFFAVAEFAVKQARKDILHYIRLDPHFQFSMEPTKVPEHAPAIVKKMAAAGQRVGVGPMAAVAGAIAQYAVEAMVERGATHTLFDNGGDIAMFLDRPAVVGIYSGKDGICNLGIRYTAMGELLGVCTSSATVGHSLSLGRTDASIILSKDVALADAAATALGNAVTKEDRDQVSKALSEAMIKGIDGAMIIIGNTIGAAGEIPEIVRANVDYNLIAKGWEVEN
ncbi:MAG: UPF0280 family protein [Candidatus Thorarchaeota archaeon]